tara:strand:+ start:711 stop:1355 length:645 start_codon:yes stop_codon:yes gene_type:complete
VRAAPYLVGIHTCFSGNRHMTPAPRLVACLAALALPLALPACGDSTKVDENLQEEATEPKPQLGLLLTDVAIRLPAVADRPGGAYFTLQSLRDEPVRIAGASVEGVGEAQLHETKMEYGVSMMASAGTIVLDPRETVQFAPGGFHVMLFDVDPSLEAGGTTDLILTLENGDKISAIARIVGPSEELPVSTTPSAPGAMEEMDHSGMASHEGMEN